MYKKSIQYRCSKTVHMRNDVIIILLYYYIFVYWSQATLMQPLQILCKNLKQRPSVQFKKYNLLTFENFMFLSNASLIIKFVKVCKNMQTLLKVNKTFLQRSLEIFSPQHMGKADSGSRDVEFFSTEYHSAVLLNILNLV